MEGAHESTALWRSPIWLTSFISLLFVVAALAFIVFYVFLSLPTFINIFSVSFKDSSIKLKRNIRAGALV